MKRFLITWLGIHGKAHLRAEQRILDILKTIGE